MRCRSRTDHSHNEAGGQAAGCPGSTRASTLSPAERGGPSRRAGGPKERATGRSWQRPLGAAPAPRGTVGASLAEAGLGRGETQGLAGNTDAGDGAGEKTKKNNQQNMNRVQWPAPNINHPHGDRDGAPVPNALAPVHPRCLPSLHLPAPPPYSAPSPTCCPPFPPPASYAAPELPPFPHPLPSPRPTPPAMTARLGPGGAAALFTSSPGPGSPAPAPAPAPAPPAPRNRKPALPPPQSRRTTWRLPCAPHRRPDRRQPLGNSAGTSVEDLITTPAPVWLLNGVGEWRGRRRGSGIWAPPS